jgi:hypothetical protein
MSTAATDGAATTFVRVDAYPFAVLRRDREIDLLLKRINSRHDHAQNVPNSEPAFGLASHQSPARPVENVEVII